MDQQAKQHFLPQCSISHFHMVAVIVLCVSQTWSQVSLAILERITLTKEGCVCINKNKAIRSYVKVAYRIRSKKCFKIKRNLGKHGGMMQLSHLTANNPLKLLTISPRQLLAFGSPFVAGVGLLISGLPQGRASERFPNY